MKAVFKIAICLLMGLTYGQSIERQVIASTENTLSNSSVIMD